MLHEVILPKLGVAVNEATIIQWLKHEGQQVNKGELFFVVETEKTTVNIEATQAGTVAKILYPEGTTLKAGQIIALLTEIGDELTDADLSAAVAKIKDKESEPKRNEILVEQNAPVTRVERAIETEVRASPSARRLMRELGISPTSVVGTGPGGTITTKDIEQMSITRTFNFSVASKTELTGTRLTIAQRLARSQSEALHVTITMDVDATLLEQLRLKVAIESKVSLTEILVPIIAQALKIYPRVNAILEEKSIKEIRNINVGVAVDTSDGLKVPVLKNADQMPLGDVIKNLRLLKEKALSGTLNLDELSDGTFTVTNLGMYGVRGFTPIINPPQCAILGVGVVEDRPVARNGSIEIRKIMTLSLSFDHRAMDGVLASKFLQSLCNMIANPDSFRLDSLKSQQAPN
jgi:pyruvate dehydrogenase E2 component (dihydrolipoyllysine-residue acetyltransferase)